MPLPIIPVVIAIGASVLGGGAVGVSGGVKMKRASTAIADAQALHERELGKYRATEQVVQQAAGEYGERQLKAQTETLGAWVAWLEANERKVKRMQRPVVDGVEVQIPDIPALKAHVVEGLKLLSGGAGAAAGAYATYQAALFGVGTFATASTGAAIGGLSGAAATNATLAWLGGGTLAAGGGGMALGAVMLSGIAAAPAVLLAGFTVGIQGEKAKTKAAEAAAQVDVAIAEMAVKGELLLSVRTRIAELRSVLDRTDARALDALERLTEVDFDPDADDHVLLFQRTALLMRAVGEIISTPIVDKEGRPTDESVRVKEKYA